ncbi:MAG: type II secretion system protein GspG [Lentisphaerae bacterium]|nr:type II secretion system protein GspG [Lentisphaerota bacterium]
MNRRGAWGGICIAVAALARLSPLHAQQAEILGFTPAGDIAWTNATPSGYTALYFTWDLTDQWFPVWYNRLATSDLDVCGTHLSSASGVTAVAELITGGQFDSTRAFYRIVTSPAPASSSAFLITNYVVFVNASTSPVTDITLDICWGHVAVSNLAPATTSQTWQLSAPFQWAWDDRFADHLVFDDDACILFYGGYRQNGLLKGMQFPFQFFSRPGYSLTVRLEDETYAVTHEELLAAQTKVRQDLQTIAAAIEQLKLDTGRWPNGAPVNNPGAQEVWNLGSANAGLLSATSLYVGWKGPYLSHIDPDPWGRSYFFDPDYYRTDGSGVFYITIGSFGPNRVGPNLYDSDNIIHVFD